MELTPQLLTDEIDFRIAVRGYDRHEVDDFLERVAVAVGQLQTQLTKAVKRAKTAEARVVELEGAASELPVRETADRAEEPSLAEPPVVEKEEPVVEEAIAQAPMAKESVADVEAVAKAPSEGVEVAAPPPAPVIVVGDDDAAADELRRTLVLAQRTADMAIREAHEEARGIVEAANDEARRNREAAQAAHAKAREEARGRLVAEIRDLETTREAMRSDTVVLERYLGTERARVRETIQVLKRLVDDPSSFVPAAVPELSPVTVPEDPTPSTVEDSVHPGSGDLQEDVALVAKEAEPTAAPSEPAAVTLPTTAEPTTVEAPAKTVPEVIAEQPDEAPDAKVADVAAAVAAPVAKASEATKPVDAPEAATPADAPESAPTDSERLGQLFAAGDGPKDWRETETERGDQGPHTQPIAAARFEEESDEEFLAELRRAMNEDEPLGPDKS